MSRVSPAFGSKLRAWRLAAGLRQQDVGEIMGVSQHAVSQWEKYGPEWNSAKMTRLEAALQLPAGTLAQTFIACSAEDADSDTNRQDRDERLDRLEAQMQELLARLADSDDGSGATRPSTSSRGRRS